VVEWKPDEHEPKNEPNSIEAIPPREGWIDGIGEDAANSRDASWQKQIEGGGDTDQGAAQEGEKKCGTHEELSLVSYSEHSAREIHDALKSHLNERSSGPAGASAGATNDEKGLTSIPALCRVRHARQRHKFGTLDVP
jgi:hypothetical protein